MDKKSKIIFIILGLAISASVAATYYRIIVEKDYIIESQVDCDPAVNKCFVWECDPISDVEGEKCTGDEEKDVWNYSILKRNAKNIPDCDPNDDSCTAYVCADNEPECEYAYCDDQTKADQGVECSVMQDAEEAADPEESAPEIAQ